MSPWPPRLVHFALSLLLCYFAGPRACGGDIADDLAGLTAFKQAVDIGGHLNWSGSDVCQWKGVQCTGTPPAERVTVVRLPGMSLFGTIPERSVGFLTELRVLSLRSNKLSGLLPEDLANCTFLRSLYLLDNDFSGPLAIDFTHWPNLVHLDLSFNNFSGPIPSSLGNLTRIKSLFLQNNSFSGSLPFIDAPSLTNFSVAYNNLSGSIPQTEVYRSFSESQFIGNNLCGFPLLACSNATPAASPSPSSPAVATETHRRKLSGGAIAGIVLGCIAALFAVLVCWVLISKKSKGKKESFYRSTPQDYASVGERVTAAAVTKVDSATTSDPERNKLVFFEGTKHVFDLEDLLRASAEVLGKGSVGTAYKAVLESGSIVAVKRLKDVTIERKEFEQIITAIGRLKHDNLVPLIAYYFSKDEKLLVNEYMTNGSLSALLHGNKGVNRTPLDWDTRVKIAHGAALGIEYLHTQGFTHGNIKSSNILLTNNYNSCVSDYGLAQLVSATPAATRIVGYRAPEVTDIRKVTPSADVYSFGVLLLELLTGKPPAASSTSDSGVDLPKWVQSVVKEEWTAEVFDVELMRFHDIEEDMVQLLQIAMTCVSPSRDQRPSMKQLVPMLHRLTKQDDGDIA